MNTLSVVVPVYNERESLAELHRQVVAVAGRLGKALDMVFVDDGSRDGSWQVISEIAAGDGRVRGVRFRRNFGKAAALRAGFAAATGDVVMTLDADLQDDPEEIPKFLELIEKGYDVISGWKQKRNDPWHKVFPSRVFNWMVSRLTGVKLHDHNCGMKCYRREVVGEVNLYGELHRFIPVLAAAKGFTVSETVVNHRARQFGRSKYGVSRFVKGFLDLLTVKFLTGFGNRPSHILGGVGLLGAAAGSLGMLYLAATWVVRYFNPDSTLEPLHQRALLSYSLAALLLGAQMIGFGLLAEMVVVRNSRDEDVFSIAERTPPTDHDQT